MNLNLRNFALWIIIVLLLLALFQLFQAQGPRTQSQEISFSQLLNETDQGHVRDVVIQGPEIHGTFTDGRSFQTYAPTSDPGLVQRLYGKGVQITARATERRALVRLDARLVAPIHRADRRVDIPVAADAGRKRQGQAFY
jgi:ATP-dependent Zn protease